MLNMQTLLKWEDISFKAVKTNTKIAGLKAYRHSNIPWDLLSHSQRVCGYGTLYNYYYYYYYLYLLPETGTGGGGLSTTGTEDVKRTGLKI